jgi:hypothetical protein
MKFRSCNFNFYQNMSYKRLQLHSEKKQIQASLRWRLQISSFHLRDFPRDTTLLTDESKSKKILRYRDTSVSIFICKIQERKVTTVCSSTFQNLNIVIIRSGLPEKVFSLWKQALGTWFHSCHSFISLRVSITF